MGNSEKESFAAVVKHAAKLITAAGRRVYSDTVTAELTGIEAATLPDAAALTRAVDLILVFGGDGTMLGAAREIAGSRTPMLGVNIGSLGFLTATSSNELSTALKRVWKGAFTFESRVLIQASGVCNGCDVEQPALNDIVIS